MTTKLIRIGNSKGIILGKSVIEHARLKDEVTLEIYPDGILIKPTKTSRRKNWDKQFRKAKGNRKPEKPILGSWGNDFDKNEWEWK